MKEEEDKQEPLHIKEEEQEEDVTKSPCAGVPLKSECEDEEDEGPSEGGGGAGPRG